MNCFYSIRREKRGSCLHLVKEMVFYLEKWNRKIINRKGRSIPLSLVKSVCKGLWAPSEILKEESSDGLCSQQEIQSRCQSRTYDRA